MVDAPLDGPIRRTLRIRSYSTFMDVRPMPIRARYSQSGSSMVDYTSYPRIYVDNLCICYVCGFRVAKEP